MCHVLSNHISSIFLRPTSALLRPTIENLSHLLTGTSKDLLFTVPEPSQLQLSHLVHHEGHSCLISNIFVPNHISPSIPTHSSQYPYYRYLHLLDMRVLDWPTIGETFQKVRVHNSNKHATSKMIKKQYKELVVTCIIEFKKHIRINYTNFKK
uniref:Putative ovule protein n=1 Tax=Solanum chacoense TaxID=4108 RepID=A0A0V0H199_SOLCH